MLQYDQEHVRAFALPEHLSEEQLVIPVPYTRWSAFKDHLNCARRIIRVEPAVAIEAYITGNLGPLPQDPVYRHSGCVVVRRFDLGPGAAILPHPCAPDAAKS